MEHESCAGAGPADCRFRLAVRSRGVGMGAETPAENSPVLPGVKSRLEKCTNISIVVCENRKRCESGRFKGRECREL